MSKFFDLCNALEACERESILHRDLKVDNILVTRDGRFKLCDFSDAKTLEKTLHRGTVKGTFSFMAPEVYHGRKYDHRADIYSLGMILYRTLNRGKEPFLPADQRIVSYRIREEALNRRMDGEPLPAPVDASAPFSDILMKACAYYPEKRYASARTFREELVRYRNQLHQKEHPTGTAVSDRGKTPAQTFPKSRTAVRYGKRTKAFYQKAAAAALLFLCFSVMGGITAWHVYQDRFANYCDPDIIRQLEEEYGFHSTARLNGNGVLTLEKNEDLYCSRRDGSYPWILQKNRIEKVIFGEQVTGFLAHLYLVGGERTNDPPVWWDTLSNCKNLTEIQIRSKTFSMDGTDLFLGDDHLIRVECPEDCAISFGSSMGMPFFDTPWYQDGSLLILGDYLVKYDRSITKADGIADDLPQQITAIGDRAFAGNDALRKVILPSGVRGIGNQAFQDCVNLEQIALPEGVLEIQSSAFQGCSHLTRIRIPESVTRMENNVFVGCSRLETLEIAEGNQTFHVSDGMLLDTANETLFWCSPLVTRTVVPENVKMISGGVFYDCDRLAELTLPDSLTNVDATLFTYCPALTQIHVTENNPVLQRNGSLLCSKDGMKVVFCMRDTAGTVQVPEGTIAINDYAFACCPQLTQVQIPETVAFIGNCAFADCTGLKSITLPASLTRIVNNVFAGCTELADIYYEGTQEEWEALTERFDLGISQGRATIHTQ